MSEVYCNFCKKKVEIQNTKGIGIDVERKGIFGKCPNCRKIIGTAFCSWCGKMVQIQNPKLFTIGNRNQQIQVKCPNGKYHIWAGKITKANTVRSVKRWTRKKQRSIND